MNNMQAYYFQAITIFDTYITGEEKKVFETNVHSKAYVDKKTSLHTRQLNLLILFALTIT